MSKNTDVPAARDEAARRHHYDVERELATRLRTAAKDQRRSLYSEVYNELYARVPDHPQLARKAARISRAQTVQAQLRFIKRFLMRGDSRFLEVGAGDCALALEVAKRSAWVYAIDVSSGITEGVTPPPNFNLLLSDGCSIPVPPASVDVAYSNQLMEHLHPDDADEQLINIYRALKPGGVYICVTPNRLSGPHDVSDGFDQVATGFHLREYTVSDLKNLFARAGFTAIGSYSAIHHAYVRTPMWIVALVESGLAKLPFTRRQRIARLPIVRGILGANLVATK